jgi:hypothetical protein
MVEDLVKIVIDPVFPPENKVKSKENGFQLLYKKGVINKRRPFEPPESFDDF